jgi:hypothetical protein
MEHTVKIRTVFLYIMMLWTVDSLDTGIHVSLCVSPLNTPVSMEQKEVEEVVGTGSNSIFLSAKLRQLKWLPTFPLSRSFFSQRQQKGMVNFTYLFAKFVISTRVRELSNRVTPIEFL